MKRIILHFTFYILIGSGCNAQKIHPSDSLNKINQSGYKNGLLEVKDSKKILFKRVWYGENEKIDSLKIFNLKGEEMKGFIPVTSVKIECLKAIQNEILKKINKKEIFENVKGNVLAHFYVSESDEIIDMRIIKGISDSIDNEVLKAIKIMDTTSSCAKNDNKITEIMINIKF